MNFADAILNSPAPAAKTALFTQQGDVTYGQLRRQAAQMAHLLLDRGLQPGDRVLLLADASLFWVQSYLGIALAGGVSVPVAPDYVTDAMEATAPHFACVQAKWLRRLATSFNGCEVVISESMPKRVERTIDLIPSETAVEAATIARSDNDLATIMFTSGSTAKPRGVMVSHGNIMANSKDIILSLEIGPAERMMAVLPFHYCYGASLLHTHLLAGASLVIDNRFLFPDKVLQNMIDTNCTSLAGVPSTYQILLRRSHLNAMDFPDLVKLQQAGGALAESFIDELEVALPAAQLYVMYGQTEATARLSCLSPAERRDHVGSIGKGLAQVQLKVVDKSGQSVAPGTVGEIVATGSSIALGYWQDEAATVRIFGDGLHTGDLATVDDDGFITIVDRARDFLKCGGTRVSCRAVEEIVLGFSGTVEAAVIGIPDDVLGEAVCLFVAHPAGTDCETELRAYCSGELDHAVQPQRIVFISELPRTSSGKPDKMALRDLIRPGKGVQA